MSEWGTLRHNKKNTAWLTRFVGFKTGDIVSVLLSENDELEIIHNSYSLGIAATGVTGDPNHENGILYGAVCVDHSATVTLLHQPPPKSWFTQCCVS